MRQLLLFLESFRSTWTVKIRDVTLPLSNNGRIKTSLKVSIHRGSDLFRFLGVFFFYHLIIFLFFDYNQTQQQTVCLFKIKSVNAYILSHALHNK